MINEVSRMKSTVKAKLKGTSQQIEYICGNSISRIYPETVQKSLMNQTQKV